MLFSRGFGIEMETTLDSYTAIRAINPKFHRFYPGGEHCGSEVRTPICTHKDWPEIRQVAKTLRENGARLSRSCGLHCHFDMRAASEAVRRRWPALWLAVEPALFLMVANSRRANGFCNRSTRPIQEYINRHIRGSSDAPLRAPSWFDPSWSALVPFTEHGSTEVRIHHGTLNCKRMKHWVMLMQVLLRETEKQAESDQVLQTWELVRAMPVPSMAQYIADIVKNNTKEATTVYLLDGINSRLASYGNPTIQVH